MLRTIHLYGALANEFGPSFRMDVKSLAEAVRAISCQIQGFRKAIEDGRFRISCGAKRGQGLKLTEELIDFGLPAGDLHITPHVKGSKSGSGLGKILIGALITGVAFFTGQTWAISLGLGLMLSGVSSLLAPKKKTEKQKTSFMTSGDNTADQGGGVPLIYGRCMCTPRTISAGVSTAPSAGVASDYAPPTYTRI